MKKFEVVPNHIDLAVRPVVSSVQVSVYTSTLLGKILTLLDASIPDDKQNKAVKDLVKSLTWNQFDILDRWCLEQHDKGGSTFPFRSGTPADMKV